MIDFDFVTCVSVPVLSGTLRAVVPGGLYEVMERLKKDDPVWSSPHVYCHWMHEVRLEGVRLSRNTHLTKHLRYFPASSMASMA